MVPPSVGSGAGVTGARRPRRGAGVPARGRGAASAKPQNPAAPCAWGAAGPGDSNPSLWLPASLKSPLGSRSQHMLLLNSWHLSEFSSQSPSLHLWTSFNSHLVCFNFSEARPCPQHHFLRTTAWEWETASSFTNEETEVLAGRRTCWGCNGLWPWPSRGRGRAVAAAVGRQKPARRRETHTAGTSLREPPPALCPRPRQTALSPGLTIHSA